MSAPLLIVEHLTVYAAWLAHGPGTARQVSGKSDLPLTELRPRTDELLAVGGVVVVGQTSDGPIFAAVSADVNMPSATDVVQRQITTLPVRDQVSIAAGVMARFGRTKKRNAAASGRAQLELMG